MKKLCIFFWIAISFIILTRTLSADGGDGHINPSVYVVPGIKISYIFGEKSAFLFGAEVSFGSLSGKGPYLFYGGVIGVDFFSSKIRLNLNFEGQNWPYPGLSAGPNILFENNDVKFGINFSIYESIGYTAIYYNFCYFPGGTLFHETGGYLKLPINLKALK